MAGNGIQEFNRLGLARPAPPETAETKLRKWFLMDTVPDWLFPKISYAFVTRNSGATGLKYCAFLITETDQVLVVGDNTNGLLALDPTIKTVDRPMYNEELSGKGITHIGWGGYIRSRGYTSVAARTSDGKIFTWGNNSCGQLGLGHKNATSGCSQVKGALTAYRVVQHCCSNYDTVCLTSSGKIVGWGARVYPKISGAAPAHYSPFVMTWRPPAPIKWIGETWGHFLALTAVDEVYSWGLDSHRSPLGRAVSDNAHIPTKIELPSEVCVMKVSCGYSQVLLLSTDGKLFTWGDNDFGQVGNGKEDGEKVYLPQLVELNERVEDIHANGRSEVSFCKTSTGVIYEWGETKGGKVFVPTATNYRSFDEALIANNCGMSSMWTRSPSPAEVQFRYRAVISKSSERKLVFEVGGTHIEALEFALNRSPVMRRKLETDWKKFIADKKQIVLQDIPNSSLFFSLMMYMHTVEVLAADEDLLDLVRLANRFEVYELGRKCAKRLQAIITESNAVDIYEVARKCDASGLVVVALDTISGFFWDVGSKSGKKPDPLILGQLVSDLQDLKFGSKLRPPCD